nr:MAG TPA: hypothetical protein [Caudoviricetes sp.]
MSNPCSLGQSQPSLDFIFIIIMEPIAVLSLFDGMSCGRLALERA